MMDRESARIHFKREGDDVLAIFPDFQRIDHQGQAVMVCYAHVGQHGEGGVGYCKKLKDATPQEYEPLLRELDRIGYDVEILNGKRYRRRRQG
jgi:hypothetical protein